MSLQSGTPADLLAAHPETAYFWGRVAADGECEGDCVTVRATDETAARRLAAIAGGASVDRRIREREYAHDTSITRTEKEHTVQVFGGAAERAAAALGLPYDGRPGGYRFGAFEEYDRQLLRGLVEGCGTVCYKSSDDGPDAVGVSFVHADERLLDTVQSLLDRIPVEATCGDLAEASSGYWFGVDDEHVPAVGEWCYEGSGESGLFAPSRRRKLRRSVEQATGECAIAGDETDGEADRDADGGSP